MSKVKMIQVVEQELYVFGKLISRHPEMPWLFSITDVYKACEVPLRREAVKYGKDTEVTYKSKRPGAWLQWNTSKTRIDSAASKIRRRIKKYGIDCGFRNTVGSNISTARCLAVLSNRELCIKSVQGNTKLRGTYVCQDFIVLYAGFLNDKLQSSVIDTFISVLNGYTDEVTKKVEKNERIAKGTQAISDNKELNSKLVEACGRKGILPMKVQEGINEGVLGLNATQYKKAFGVKEPFNDNILEVQVATKNVGIIMATTIISTHKKPKLSNVEGKQIGKDSSLRAKIIFTDPEVIKYLDSAVRRLEALS